MMRWYGALVCAAILSSAAHGEVGVGENLLVNGDFRTLQTDFPVFWSRSSRTHVTLDRAGGPGGKLPSVVLRNDGPDPAGASARQQGMTLVAGETYKLSAYVKTKGFQCRGGGLVVHNAGWTKASGFSRLPADRDWTLMEMTFILPPSKNSEYGLAMHATDLKGEIQFADLKLEAVSERARQGSKSQSSIVAAPRLVPLRPLLNRIPRAGPELVFQFYGMLPENRENHQCVVSVASARIGPQTLALAEGPMVARFAGLPCGDDRVKVVVRHGRTQKTVIEAIWPISIVELPSAGGGRAKPLNNLVAELLSEPVKKTPQTQTFTFFNPREGWVFVSLARGAGKDLAVRIDDRQPVITAATERREAFRELSMGEHRVSVHGNTADARLVVRSIPEIFNYPPCMNSAVKENGSYDWEFMKRHVLYAVTTLNGGRLPGDALEEAKARGLKWLANFNVDPVDDPADVAARMEKHAGMTQPQYDGFTSDELFFARPAIDNYTGALGRLHNPESRLVYTWIVGQPSLPGLHTAFMSACLNASKGRGRLLFEAYCAPQADEKAAETYLDEKVGETMRAFNAFLPGAAAGTGMIFGNFNQIPIISLEHNPAVDFKYFLDMQVNLVANSPDFKDLATTGYWGTYYGDEEMVRWSFKLMRHYAVEGSRDMLSRRYGFKYNPGLLANGDFAEGLEGWTAAPARPNAIRAHRVPGYGKNCQGRWSAGSAGDTVCVMARAPGKPSRISQAVQGLEPGRAYVLQFVTADLKDVAAGRHNPRRYGIDVELAGVEVLADRGFVHVDRRKSQSKRDPRYLGKINLHRIVFRAQGPTMTVAFNDEKAIPGEELLLNFVQLKPYLE